jgi:gliding motility-associated-like protein
VQLSVSHLAKSNFATLFTPLNLKKVIKYLIALLVFAANVSAVQAQSLPTSSIECLDMAPNGDVTVSWSIPVDPLNEFVAYHVMESVNMGGPYAEVGLVPAYLTNSYLHNTTLPLANSVHYFIFTESSDGLNTYFSNPSDTVCTMYLDVSVSSNPLGFATLDWNSPYSVDYTPPSGAQYEVWMEYPAGTWTMIQNLPYGISYWSYEISICSAFLNFRVDLVLPGGCTMESNEDGDNFTDLTYPEPPTVTSVSIDPQNGDAIISWLPPPAGDTQGYIVYECVNNIPVILDTIWSAATTQFIDLTAASVIGQVSYAVAAFDTCYTGFPPSPNTSPANCNTSLHLETNIPYAICDDYMQFSWEGYEGWDFGTDMHIIYHAFLPIGSVNQPVYLPIDTVPGNVFQYIHYNMPVDGINYYYVSAVAVGSGYTAQSNAVGVTTPYPVASSYFYLSSVHVISDGLIEVEIDLESVNWTQNFNLQRYDEETMQWVDLITINAMNADSALVQDSDVSADVFSYSYRFIVTNMCDDVLDTTNIGTSILLEGVENTERVVNILNWSVYDGWTNGVEKYLIHRSIGENGPDQVIANVSGSVFAYEDDVSGLLYTPGQFCYHIEAIERAPNVTAKINSSNSNVLCLSQDPKIWIPNAFIVGGVNDIWRPIISFADFLAFKMIIYSRWGDVIYETNDINSPWDGKMNDKIVQEGSYAYYIYIEDGKGKAYEYRGYVVTLINN